MRDDVPDLIRAADDAVQSGRWREAERLWCAVLDIEPQDFDALWGLGFEALRRGDAHGARPLLQSALDQAPSAVVALTLATACRESGDENGERRAIEEALSLEPQCLPALLAKADLLERLGDITACANVCRNVLAAAGPAGAWPPALREQLQHVLAVAQAHPLVRRGEARFEALPEFELALS